MRYELYIDVFFVLNLIMDCIVLKASKCLVKGRSSWGRIIGAAGAASLLTCIMVIVPIKNTLINITILYIVISGIMSVICFKVRSIREIVKNTISIYVLTFMLGGAMLAAYQFTPIGYYLIKLFRGEISNVISVRAFIWILFLGVIMLYAGVALKERKIRYSNLIKEINLCYRDRTISIRGLIDTGNQLLEPITHKPVIVCELGSIKELFTQSEYEGLNDFRLEEGFEKIFVIPYNAIGNSNGVIMGISIDRIHMFGEKEGCIIERPIIGLYSKKLSATNEFQAILPSVFFS